MTGWGDERWGAGPWGGGEGVGGVSFVLTGALAVRENVARLFFSQAVALSGVLDALDGTLKSHYLISPVDGTFGYDGEPARSVLVIGAQATDDLAQVDVLVDRPFSPYPSQYQVTATGLFTATGTPQTTTFSAVFYGVQMGVPPPTADLASPGRDFANPQTLSAALDPLPNAGDPLLLGTLAVDDTGDRATDQGVTNLRKRVLRRLSTRKGRFAHLPNYGVLALDLIKSKARPGLVQSLAADAEDQIRQEPDVVGCSVSIRQADSSGVFVYVVRVRSRFGRDFQLKSPVLIGGT